MIRTTETRMCGSTVSFCNHRGGLSRHDVDIRQVDLRFRAAEANRLAGYLSDDETERTGRFYFEEDRMRAILVRGTLRELLGQYTARHPREIEFAYGHHGKPRLADGSGSDVTFNLSHSGSIALFAFSRGRSVGIDVERIRPDLRAREIAGGLFAPGEIAALQSASPLQGMELFYQYWTRKEAFVKVTGEGISFPLDHYDVSGIDGRRLAPVVLRNHEPWSVRWYGQDLFPRPGYAAAIVVEGWGGKLSCVEIP